MLVGKPSALLSASTKLIVKKNQNNSVSTKGQFANLGKR